MAKKKSDQKWVKVHIPADLAERLEQDGHDLDDQVADILRAHLDGAAPRSDAGHKFASFITEAMAPLKDHPMAPQLEKVAKDVASKVAKDVATAAATAAFAAWTAKMSQKAEGPAKSNGDAGSPTAEPGAPDQNTPKS